MKTTMKNESMIVLGLAGLAVYLILKAKGQDPLAGSADPLKTVVPGTSEVLASNGQQFANGWRYFTDGTSIDPAGNYYYQGQQVYKAGSGATGAW